MKDQPPSTTYFDDAPWYIPRRKQPSQPSLLPPPTPDMSVSIPNNHPNAANNIADSWSGPQQGGGPLRTYIVRSRAPRHATEFETEELQDHVVE